jgi:hypothetical protein
MSLGFPMETNAKDPKRASKVRLLWPIVTVCFLSLLLWIASFISVDPMGRFHEPNVSWVGEAFYEFRDGQAKLVLVHPEPGRGRVERPLSTYKFIDEHWTLVSDEGPSKMRVRATLFSITISNEDGTLAKRYNRKWF